MFDPREDSMTVDKARTEVPAVRRSQQRLTVEDIAARRAEESESAGLEIVTREEVPARTEPPADPSVTLRHARIGLFAALTLVLLLVWIMQRRKGKD